MKKLIIAFLSSIFFFAVPIFAKPRSVTETSPVAILSITGNKSVPWFEGNSPSAYEGALTGKINEKMNRLSPERETAVSRLDYAYDSFVAAFGKKEGASIIEKELVASSDAYKKCLEGTPKYLSVRAGATGLKKLSDMSKKNARAVLNEIGAKSAFFMDFEFWKVRKNSKVLSALVILKVRVVNDEGKEIVSKRYSVESSSGIPISGKSYNTDGLLALLNFTIDEAIDKFISDSFE